MSAYPLHLDLQDKKVLVVGAGRVAERRIADLVEAGADVVVVAPEATARIRTQAEAGIITWRERVFDYSDVLGTWLVQAVTDSVDVNTQVAAEAERRGIWAVRADRGAASAAHTPARVSHDGVTVSVTSGDPRRTQLIRDAIGFGLQDGSLNSRRQRIRAQGSVVLIGGGPGADDLITVRGRRELLSADVIVFDRLAPTSLLEFVDPDVELIDASKSPGKHTLSQEQINEILVDRAARGRRVARLKGGDPFVLGRGSEEVIACTEAGVAVEVIPGVTSAISAPAAVGIPVTHRGLSTGFVVVSGHALPDVRVLAQTDLTLVVLMGVGRLAELTSGLIAHGKDPKTPIAIIERAYSPDERTTVGTLASIVAIAERVGVANPAIIVIGDVVDVPRVVAAKASNLAATETVHA